ncbi:hypothetical protein HHK36_011941 [Tetracentron sinense]|uniref:MULE transposase domain-containing protein n=1 Tax=Tetracentron sinense TaxID=13715 RepID=A0A834ZBG6_TETSI|nr:hypothetical protein HHK36_011941 [Tetracentron sinense]
MTENSKRLIKSWNDSGLRLSQCHNLMANETGGYENLGFDEVNMSGVNRRSKAAMETYGSNAGRMMDYFRDVKTRLNYIHFGDVVSFDTTYKKNKFLMLFALFTGVNHHRQSIVVGCALLVVETEDSFVWLFEE